MAKGSCLCGSVRYEYSGEPVQKVLCHCLTCRKVTGSTYSVCLMVPTPAFKFTSSGSLKRTIAKHESGMELELNFCGDCGSLVCKEPQGAANQGVMIVFGGTLDEGSESTQALALEKMKPQAELWIKYRVGWLPAIEGAAQMQGFE